MLEFSCWVKSSYTIVTVVDFLIFSIKLVSVTPIPKSSIEAGIKAFDINLISAMVSSTIFFTPLFSQDYFYAKYAPFEKAVPAPSDFFGFGIGEYHARHDQIISYFKKLDEVSDHATYMEYGKSFEGRPLSMLIISSPENLKNLENIRKHHIEQITKYDEKQAADLPVIINLGYSVHGNEPSSTESAILTAYTLLASQKTEIKNYLKNAIIFIDPAINPDGRETDSGIKNIETQS